MTSTELSGRTPPRANVGLYLAHVGGGASLRSVARSRGLHPSRVLRAVRSVESRRDDPLVDEALRVLVEGQQENAAMTATAQLAIPSEAEIDAECARALRRMAETGAVLAIAEGLPTAVIVREVPGGEATRTATIPRAVAREMALRDWITCQRQGRIARYAIASTGRAALKKMVAEEALRTGFAEAPGAAIEPEARALRSVLSESPLAGLARRRDKAGKPFLAPELVAIGERLREDFELAQMAEGETDWDAHVAGRAAPGGAATGPTAARARTAGALRDLGPGLGDVALSTCCRLEGLESVEKRLGWSARSGKIVLRIALQRLVQHYEALGDAGKMMG